MSEVQTPPVTPPVETPAGEKPPELILGKFKSVDDLAKSYKELESKLGKAKPEPMVIETPPVPDDAGVSTIVESAGLSMADLEAEYAKNGKLTDEQYAKLKAKGHGRAFVDDMAKLIVAEGQLKTTVVMQARAQAEAIAGGKEQLAALLSTKGLVSDAERPDFERRLNDPRLTEGAVRDLKARHLAAVGAGNAKPLVEGTPTGGTPIPRTAAEAMSLSDRVFKMDPEAIKIMADIRRSGKHHEWSKV